MSYGLNKNDCRKNGIDQDEIGDDPELVALTRLGKIRVFFD